MTLVVKAAIKPAIHVALTLLDSVRGTGPQLGCTCCHETLLSQVHMDLGGMFHHIYCPNCLQTFLEVEI